MPGGDLPVAGGEQIVPLINELRQLPFGLVVLTADAHPRGHVSFASAHRRCPSQREGPRDTGAVIPLCYSRQGLLCNHTHVYPSQYSVECDTGGKHAAAAFYHVQQRLWPDHCISSGEAADEGGRSSAGFHPGLQRYRGQDLIIRKGSQPHIDSYSAFFDNGHIQATELHDALMKRGIRRVYIVGNHEAAACAAIGRALALQRCSYCCVSTLLPDGLHHPMLVDDFLMLHVLAGLALDVCVLFTAKDAALLGYEVFVIRDLTRPITPQGGKDAEGQMAELGVRVIDSSRLLLGHHAIDAPPA